MPKAINTEYKLLFLELSWCRFELVAVCFVESLRVHVNNGIYMTFEIIDTMGYCYSLMT